MPAHRRQTFRRALVNLDHGRSSVATCTLAALDCGVEHAWAVVAELVRAGTDPKQRLTLRGLHRRLGVLYVASDLLHNAGDTTTSVVKGAPLFRAALEHWMPTLFFQSLHPVLRSSRWSFTVRDAFRDAVVVVLRTWQTWRAFPDDYLAGLAFLLTLDLSRLPEARRHQAARVARLEGSEEKELGRVGRRWGVHVVGEVDRKGLVDRVVLLTHLLGGGEGGVVGGWDEIALLAALLPPTVVADEEEEEVEKEAQREELYAKKTIVAEEGSGVVARETAEEELPKANSLLPGRKAAGVPRKRSRWMDEEEDQAGNEG